MSVQDDYTSLLKLARRAAEGYPLPRPNYLETWWQTQVPIIAAEEAAKAAKLAARKQELQDKIAALEAELAALP